MSSHPQHPQPGPAAISPQRTAEIAEVIQRVTRWAASRSDITGLLLAGSCARGTPGPGSDIDLVLLTTDQTRYRRNDWAGELSLDQPVRTKSWGPLTEQRFTTASGLEIEINIGPPDWASTNPVDPGTRRVVTDGARPLHDPAGTLATLLSACRP